MELFTILMFLKIRLVCGTLVFPKTILLLDFLVAFLKIATSKKVQKEEKENL